MSYRMYRIFCAAADELEAERQAFHKAVGDFNESEAMQRGMLFVPVSLRLGVPDKRPIQPVIDANIRDCAYYIQILQDGWGPPNKSFEGDYRLALECAASETAPMKEVVALSRSESGEFQDMPGFERQLQILFSRWLDALTAIPASAS